MIKPMNNKKGKTLTNLYFTSPKSPYLTFPTVIRFFNFTAHILYQFTSTRSYSYLPLSFSKFQIFRSSLLLISVRSLYLSSNFQALNLVLQHQRFSLSGTVVTWLLFFSLSNFFNSKHLPADINFPVKRRNHVNLKNRPQFSKPYDLTSVWMVSCFFLV